MMIALLLLGGVDSCVRLHQSRHVDFRRGKRLGKYDHLIEWHKPQRPQWMDEETYATIPEKIVLREIRFNVVEKGRRVETLTIVTTLLDPHQYSKEEIAELYGFRWNSETIHAHYDERFTFSQRDQWAYSGNQGVIRLGTLVPAAPAWPHRRRAMSDVTDDRVPPRAQHLPFRAFC